MNTNMLDNPITQDNIKALQDRGTIFIEPAEGELACGVSGRGRLPEVDIIYQNIIDILNSKKDLQGKTVMITAGPTQEDMDPVRFITNRSTGKMGYALAREAINRGARVILVSGPTSLAEPANAEIYRVRSACEMNEICIELFDQVDIVVATAAVADYRPLSYSDQKIKKNDTDDDLTLKLTRNPDILEGLGKRKKHQILIGFAAETSSLIENARAKMQKKNLDYLVANDLTREGAGFGVDTNICSLIFRDGTVKDLPQISKGEVARIIFDNLPAGQVTE
jgi:phosphopantothenoylcysteine decarboxylase/phosphopantothenate--cysteine ligase